MRSATETAYRPHSLTIKYTEKIDEQTASETNAVLTSFKPPGSLGAVGKRSWTCTHGRRGGARRSSVCFQIHNDGNSKFGGDGRAGGGDRDDGDGCRETRRMTTLLAKSFGRATA